MKTNWNKEQLLKMAMKTKSDTINKQTELNKKPLILIVGNPNVGKTTIYNKLAQKHAITANYSFTTIELNSDFIQIGTDIYELVDTAGIYRLDNPSEEGQLTRKLIFDDRDKIIIQVIEAAKLEQSLLLTAQLLELNLPLLVVLNMNDELGMHGIRINSRVLSESLGVPIIETIATENKGIDNVKKILSSLTVSKNPRNYPIICKKYFKQMESIFPDSNGPPQSIFTLYAMEDPFAKKWLSEHYDSRTVAQVNQNFIRFIDKYIVNLSITFLNSQTNWIRNVVNSVVLKKEELTKFGVQKFGELSRHPIFGWFIMIGIVAVTYLIVGKFGASFLVTTIENQLFAPLISYLESVITQPFFKRMIIGDYGLLTTGLFNAVGTVLPIITLFFLMLNLLEDTGYLTNLIILTSRVFKKIGLTGKSILPIVLGFGCKTMATISTKILDTKKEKYIAIFLIGLAIPCSSQMSIIIAVLSREPLLAFGLVMFILLILEMSAGLILNKIIPQDKQSDFIIELPPIRIPDVRLLFQKTFYRTVWFLKEAVPLFLVGAFILFVLDETSLMRLLEMALRPVVVDFLSLPINFSEAMVMSLARSEAGAVLIMNMAASGQLSTAQVIVAIIVITLFIPCISNVMAIFKELKFKKSVILIAAITLISILIGGLVNILLQLINYRG